jgi:hypothetical protein
MFLLRSLLNRRPVTIRLYIIFAILVIGLSACQAPQQTSTTQTTTTQSAGTAPSQSAPTVQPPVNPPSSSITWTADGIISPGEYQNHKSFDDFEINWSNDDQYIYIGMKAKTMGWVAVGFGATTFMNNANIIQGYFSDGKAVVADEYSTGEFGPHPDVTTLGGTYAILDSGGTQADGYTIIEFKRKLDPGDKFHKALAKGTNNIIWAYGSDNQFLIKHVSRGTGQITIQ